MNLNLSILSHLEKNKIKSLMERTRYLYNENATFFLLECLQMKERHNNQENGFHFLKGI